jgi:hypothetical protein
MSIKIHRRSPILLLFLLVCFLPFTFRYISGSDNPKDTAAAELVRRIIQNEIKEEKADNSHWTYLKHSKEGSDNKIAKVVQTNSLDLDLLFNENGHRLTEEELKSELGRSAWGESPRIQLRWFARAVSPLYTVVDL